MSRFVLSFTSCRIRSFGPCLLVTSLALLLLFAPALAHGQFTAAGFVGSIGSGAFAESSSTHAVPLVSFSTVGKAGTELLVHLGGGVVNTSVPARS
ncbi:MAG: hypothetical protein ACLP6G_02365 [Terriglobales bacterium]